MSDHHHDNDDMARIERKLAFEESEPPLPEENVLHSCSEICGEFGATIAEMIGLGGLLSQIFGGDSVSVLAGIYWILVYAEMHPAEIVDIRRAILEQADCGSPEHGKKRAELFDRQMRLRVRQWREMHRIEYVVGAK